MSITLLTGSYADRHRCPECNTFVSVLQTTFGDPCPKCGHSSEGRNLGDWKWERSRWRFVLGWPMIVWDKRD